MRSLTFCLLSPWAQGTPYFRRPQFWLPGETFRACPPPLARTDIDKHHGAARGTVTN